MTRLPRSFFEVDPLELGRCLIGMELYSELSGASCGGLIVETEVYIGPDDRASHAWQGRKTSRTEVQFGPRGHAYIYQIYGMYYCFNVVVGKGHMPAVVLVRALRPTIGLTTMARNRGFLGVPNDLRMLTSGPGRLTQALGIERHASGLDVCMKPLCIRGSCEGRRLVLAPGITATARVNIDYAGDWATKPWRFTLNGDPYVTGRRRREAAEATTGWSSGSE